MTVQVHGVLRHVLESEVAELARKITRDRGDPEQADRHRLGRAATINPGLLLHRLWLGDDRDDEVSLGLKVAHLRAVADAFRNVPADLLEALHARRAAAAAALAARRPGWVWRAVRIEPRWRLVLGHGEGSVHETSLTLAPGHGVPVLPGSALKGLAATAARDAGWSDRDTTLFGSPRPGQESQAHRGAVLIWDALPTARPELVLDVLTPHVRDYYDAGNTTGYPVIPPAEYHNPVPVRFLAVQNTHFRAHLIGPEPDVAHCVRLIRLGLDEFGIGGRTAAGYGYCSASEEVPA